MYNDNNKYAMLNRNGDIKQKPSFLGLIYSLEWNRSIIYSHTNVKKIPIK